MLYCLFVVPRFSAYIAQRNDIPMSIDQLIVQDAVVI